MLSTVASLLCVSTIVRFLMLWVREPAPLIQPPTQAMPSIKLPGALPLVARNQCDAAFLKAAAAGGFSLEVQALLLDCLGGSLGQTAAMGEDTPVVGGVVQFFFLQSFWSDIPAVEESLQFLEGQDTVYVFADLGAQIFVFLCGAGADKNGFGIFAVLLDGLWPLRPWGRGCGRCSQPGSGTRCGCN